MFLLLLSSVGSFGDELSVIATGLAFRQIGDDAPALFRKVFAKTGENYGREEAAGAWINFVERAPYNLDCFNHWRYAFTPINPEGVEFPEHNDAEDLEQTLVGLNNKLKAGALKDLWSFSFAIKARAGLLLDAYSPVHAAEYYSSSLINGSNHGKDFYVRKNGVNVSLYDYWESGCGDYSHALPFSNSVWDALERTITRIAAANPYDKRDPPRISDVMHTTGNITKNYVYTIEEGSEITDEYHSKCIEITEKQVASAAYHLSKLFIVPVNQLPPDVPSKKPMYSTEFIAWVAAGFLVPIALIMLWNFFDEKLKQE